MSSRSIIVAGIIGAFLLLTGCSPWNFDEQVDIANAVPLNSSSSVGQTFTAKQDGLSNISIYLQPSASESGELILSLYPSPNKEKLLALSTLSRSSVDKANWYDFEFSAQPRSNQKDYYFELTTAENGEVLVSTAPGDAYIEGANYINGKPQDAQTSFKLSYAAKSALIGLMWEGIQWVKYLVISLFLFVIPGWGLLSYAFPNWHRFGWSEKLALSAGTSLTFYPVLYLWTYLAGIHIGRTLAWFIPLAGTLLLIVKAFQSYWAHGWSFPKKGDNESILINVLLVILIGLLITSRLIIVRSLDTPLWGDSYQHTMISQLLTSNNGLFNSWEPFTSLQSFTYHFGFHTLVATFQWITDLPTTASIIWVGQLINILAILVLIPLANKVGESSWAGVFAILVAGLLTSLPQIYTNWGRYTQLAGLVIMPVLIFFLWHYLENGNHWPTLILLWFLFAGLALTHYRVLIMALLFIPVILIFDVKRVGAWPLLRRIFLAGIGGAFLFFPWFIHVFSGRIFDIVGFQLGTPANKLSDFIREYNMIGSLSNYLEPFAWVLLVACMAWGLLKKNLSAIIVSVWWIVIILSANPTWFNLPGAGTISNFAVFISMYIPLGILVGGAAGWLITWFHQKNANKYYQRAVGIFLFVIIIIFGFFGEHARSMELDQKRYELFTRPDQRAAEWIEEHLPQDAKFLVNSFFAYGGTVIAGSDGGWWLPLKTNRQTTQPPLNYGNENGPIDNYVKWINALQLEIQTKGINHPEVLEELNSRGINYIFIGQRRGQVGNSGYAIDPGALLTSPNFTLVYNQDRVYIFKIVQTQ